MQRARPSLGITSPFSAEYKARTASVNKNLGLVRKAEQPRRVIRATRPMRLGTASGVECPTCFEQLLKCYDVSIGLVPDDTKLRSCTISCRRWQTQRVAAGSQSRIHGCYTSIKFHPTLLSSLCSSRSELAPQTGASNRDRFSGEPLHDFVHEKKVF